MATERFGRAGLLDLILFKAYAELKSESSRYYLSVFWWALEPILALGVYYVIFGLLIARDYPDFVPFLLIGLAGWQWFEHTSLHAMSTIYQGGGLMNKVNIPKVYFPAVYLCVDTVKFLFVLTLVLVFLWVYGMLPNLAYFALPVVLAVEFILIAGTAFLLAALMPFVPDMKYLVQTIFRLAFFGSGVIIPLSRIPEEYRQILEYNPMVHLLDSYREILMFQNWPDWQALFFVALLGGGLLVIALAVISRFEYAYPRYVR